MKSARDPQGPFRRPAQDRPSDRPPIPEPRRRLPLFELSALLLLLLVGVATAAYFTRLSSEPSMFGTPPAASASSAVSRPRPDPAAAEALTARGQLLLLTGAAQPAAGMASGAGIPAATSSTQASGWASLISADADAAGLFLQRLATSPAYLRQQKDDPSFVSDFWALLQAAAPSAPATPPALAAGESRIAWLARALTAAGLSVPGEWTSASLSASGTDAAPAVGSGSVAGPATAVLGDLQLKPETPRNGAVVFGRRLLGGTVQAAAAGTGAGNTEQGTGYAAQGISSVLLCRTFLQVEGRVVTATDAARLGSEPAGFTLPLDVRGYRPGSYHTEIFVLASDGRGRHADLGSLEVPMISQLSAGAVLDLSLPANAPSSAAIGQPAGTGQSAGSSSTVFTAAVSPDASGARYAAFYPEETRQGLRYAITVANPGAPVAAELFSLSGERVATCDNPDTRWEGLRALLPAAAGVPEADRVAYVRIGRVRSTGEAAATTDGQGGAGASGSSGALLPFTLVQADRAATLKSQPDKVFAVLGEKDSQLQLQDKTGTRSTRAASDLDVAEFSARLSQLALVTDVGTADVFPEFEAEMDTFGLYLPAGSGPLSIRAYAREGSFASIEAVAQPGIAAAGDGSGNQSASAAGSGTASAAGAAATPTISPDRTNAALTKTITLPADECTLAITVRSGDGTARTYQVHILQAGGQSGFESVLDAFPSSYRSPLYLLHVQHPAYQFTADPVDLDFSEFLAGETVRDRSLVDSSSAPASWVKPGSPVYDGKYWKAAATAVVAYFGDPRNFLTERDIFQFELLRFQSEAHTAKGIAAVLAGTFMAAGSDKNPDHIDYAQLLLDAGRTANISPLHLASRIVQEMGRNGTSPLAFGKLSGYEGVYNFYNIGATPNPSVTNGAQINGAKYALYGLKPDEMQITPDEAVYQLPWTSPARAITGGAIWIAQRYTGIGQDTLYLQKFDLAAADGLYIHQYAQNIQMAWAEGRRTQAAYRDAGLLDQAFTFRIPVFRTLPALRSLLPDTVTRIR